MSLKVFSAGEKIRAADFNDNFGVVDGKINTVDGFINGTAPIPVGFIAMWSGSSESVPVKFQICDGTNGTPNLSGMFMVEAGDSYNLADTGGLSTVTLTESQMPSHAHGGASIVVAQAGSHTHTYPRHNSQTVVGRCGGACRGGTWQGGGNSNTGSSGSHQHSITGTSGSTGSGNAHNNLPPYYVLAYIQKVLL